MSQEIEINGLQSSQAVNNWLFFIGGIILNLLGLIKILKPLPVHQLVEYFFSADFSIHILKSVVGGLIALLFKLIYDFIKRKSKGGQSNA